MQKSGLFSKLRKGATAISYNSSSIFDILEKPKTQTNVLMFERSSLEEVSKGVSKAVKSLAVFVTALHFAIFKEF